MRASIARSTAWRATTDAAASAQRQARAMHAKLERASMTQIFQGGLHEFITTFIEDNAGLSSTISEQYLFT